MHLMSEYTPFPSQDYSVLNICMIYKD